MPIDRPATSHHDRCACTTILTLALVVALVLPCSAQAWESLPPDARPLLMRALPEADPGLAPGHALFDQVVSTELFLHRAVGPFDLYVMQADGLAERRDALQLADDLAEGLAPAAALVEQLWGVSGDGLISGTRLSMVVGASSSGQPGFASLVALLDHCEALGYSGWAPANRVDTPAQRSAEVVRTWEVQLINLAHPLVAERRAAWVEHGVGYYALSLVVNRALRLGAWGMVPPWLAQGLIDELDIAAHGRAWVGQQSQVVQIPGWFRPGWSGFVPEGHRPPPPVVGPPADRATTVLDTGDPWLSFEASAERHWGALRRDQEADVPFSLAATTAARSDLPRDRAAARCLLHLLVTLECGQGPALTGLLDRPARTALDGMPDSEPLPVLVARALGGVPEVQRLDDLSTRELLTELGRPELIELLESHAAAAALELSDHREQSRWLSRRQVDAGTRSLLFQAFLEIEFHQQLAMWVALSPHLDSALVAALAAARRYPRSDREQSKVRTAFRAGLLAQPSLTRADDPAGHALDSHRSRRR